MRTSFFRRFDGALAERRSITLLTLCIAVLVAQVDTAVVNLAARPIGQYFSASVQALQWVMDSYNLAYAVLLLTGGLLADLYGRRRIFMLGALLFTAASLLCACAPAISVLLLGRALAGVGAALLVPASLAVIRVVWHEPAERGRALGIWAACNGVAMAIAPTLGGFFVNRFGWRSVFYMVIPLGLAALALAIPSIPESAAPRNRSFDLRAQVLGAVALGSLALGATQSHRGFGIVFLGVAIAALALFLFIKAEAKSGPDALVPLDIFRARAFNGAMVATAGMTFGIYGTLFLLPLTWQQTGRLDAQGAGLALMPLALVFVAVSVLSETLAKKLGGRFMTAGGVAFMAAGLFVIGASAHLASLVPQEAGLALAGLGLGLATGPLMGAAVGAVSAARAGTASALINVARMAGATLGVAILGAVFAIAHSGVAGLRASMLAGGLLQLFCAGTAWVATRGKPRAATLAS